MPDSPQAGWRPLTGTSHGLALELLLHGPMSRNELSKRLDLSPASLTRLAKPLLDRGLIRETAPCTVSGSGRPGRPLEVVGSAHHFIGITFTESDLDAVVTTLRAEVIARQHVTLTNTDPAEVVRLIAHVVTHLTAHIPATTGIGVSIGGQTTDHRLLTEAVFLGWSFDVPLADMVEAATSLPTIIDNNLVALAKAEHWFGAARDLSHFAILTTGVGVGYALVIADQIIESPDAGVGLVGHYPLDPMGPRCRKGHRGCAEAMLSIPTISAQVSMGLQRAVSYEECLELASAGNPVAVGVITDAGRALGRLIAAVANLTMTPRIILTGEGIRLADVARGALEEGVKLDRHPDAKPVHYEIQPLDRTQWARGAAVAAIQQFVLGSEPHPPGANTVRR